MTTEARTAVHALSLHALFEQQARLTPTATALEIPPHARDPRRQRLSYADLDSAAERLADRLAAFINGEAVVALCLPRAGLDLFVAQLATHKAGGAWTVIESGTPPERLRFLLEDSRAVAVVADEPALPTLLAAGFPSDRILAPSGPAPERKPQRRASSPDSLAYVIYTSGTTGHPKGVMIEHRMAANLVLADVDYFELGSRDRVASSFLRYLLVLAVAYAVNLVTVLFVQSRFDLNNYLAQAMGIIPYALIGFLGSRYFAFRSQRGGTQGVNQENITPIFQENTCLRK